MFCFRQFSLTVDAMIACCLESFASTPTTTPAQGMAYATTDDRVFAIGDSSGAGNIYVIDPATNTVISTIAVGGQMGGALYSPINNRIYVTAFAAGIHVINPTTMALESTIALPAPMATLGQMSYDFTNNLIYGIGSGAAAWQVMSLNPVTGIPSVLVSEAEPAAPDTFRFGTRCVHASINNRIYVPSAFFDDSLATLTKTIRVYSAAGAFIEAIAIPLATSDDGSDQMFWSADTGFLYFLSNTAFNNLEGALVLNPADNSTVAFLASTGGIGTMEFSTECSEVLVLSAGLDLFQYNDMTHALTCSADVGLIIGPWIQMAVAANNNVYIPDFFTSNVDVFRPPP